MPIRRALPTPWFGQSDHTLHLAVAAYAALAAAAVGAIVMPRWFWTPLAIAAVAGVGVLAFSHTILLCMVWLLIAGATLEMTLMDLVGPAAFQVTIAVVKATELGLAMLCIVRFGPSLDVFNPAFAFLAMFVVGVAHGLHPDLSLTDSLRSLVGSVAPFAFAFSRLSPDWGRAMIRMAAWIPLVTLAAAAALDVAGVRSLFVDSGGERLAGLGHPAFLAGICLTAIYACLIELYREGQSRWLVLMAVNFMFLVLTGARAPLAYAVAVTGLTLAFLRSSTLPPRCRFLPIMLAACLLPVMAVLASQLSSVRLFYVLMNQAADLSGRDLLWPPFQQAAAASPWFGWGVGAGNAIIPQDSDLAKLIMTWAAHNEYLRMAVEGGQFGRGLLILLFVAWVVQHTKVLCRTDRVIMRLVFLAFAAHCYTDNVLISTPACVFFAFATAVFARGAWEARKIMEPQMNADERG